MRVVAAHGSRPLWPVLLCALLLLAAVSPPVSAGHPAGTGQPAAGTTAQARTDATLNASAMAFRVRLGADGDARWRVVLRFPLDSANETRAFDRLATEFRENRSAFITVTPFREAASAAASATGRTMRITNVSRTAGRTNGTGTLELAFTWTNFARTDGSRIVLGDVFRTGTGEDAGTWLPRLTDEQELLIVFPDGYAAESASTGLTNGTLQIEGPAAFQPGEPSAVLVPEANVRSTASPEPGGSLGATTIGGAVVLLVLLAAGVVLYRRRDRSPTVPTADAGDAADGPTAGTNDPDPDTTAPDAAGSRDEGTEPGAADPEEPLLSDEERVLRLLRANDGRMKQRRIVEETGWSNAKVSQLLSEMAEDGRVEKLRIGRENLISLPGEAPDGVD